MSTQWRCTQCATLHGDPAIFSSNPPEECRNCGNAEFQTLGMDDDEERDLGRLFNLDAFSWMAMGIAVYNVIFALLGGFANESGMLYSAGASFVVMLLVVYLMSNRSRSSWTVGAIAFVGVFALGVAIVAPFTPYGEDPLFLVYGAIYVVLGPLGLAMLIGGRDQIQGPDGAAS